MNVWIVSLEWNFPSSEVTDDTGIVGVYATEELARASQKESQQEFDADGQTVYQYSMAAGRYCIACGEVEVDDDGAQHACRNAFPDDAEEFCDHCGAELGANNSCDNDHDEWDIDVHCTEHEVQAVEAEPICPTCKDPQSVQIVPKGSGDAMCAYCGADWPPA